jgi:hypothetical protein
MIVALPRPAHKLWLPVAQETWYRFLVFGLSTSAERQNTCKAFFRFGRTLAVDAWIYDIVTRRDMRGWANLDDFERGEGRKTEPEIVLTDRRWSLYGLDEERALAVFVDLPESTDLAQSPFAYATQHQQARRLLTMPLDTFERLGECAPPVEKVVLIFSIGRCGSTLLSHAMNAVPGVWCLSEPDVFSTLIMQHYHSRRRTSFAPDQIVRLIRASVRLQFRPPSADAVQVFAIKFRSQALFQASLYHRALPEAACVFLYRDALGWANSIYGMMRQYDFADRLNGEERALPWTIFTAAADPLWLDQAVDMSAHDLPMELPLAPAWACNMAEYMHHLTAGVPFKALRYDALTKHRRESLVALMHHCKLPADAADGALAAFDADSQAGTHLSRNVVVDKLSAARMARLGEILTRIPKFGNPDLHLPDIYS